MIEIIPAIIPRNREELEQKVGRVFSLVSKVQVDVLDRRYTDKQSWPYSNDFKDFKVLEEEEIGLPHWDDIDYQFDLMVNNAEEEMMHYVKAGASSLIFHIESESNIDLAIDKAKITEVEIGLALKPSTPTEVLDKYIERIDFVQFMGNDKIGENGVSLDQNIYEKISLFHNQHPDKIISVDIGVNLDTAGKLKECGVSRLVSGSAIFDSPDPEETINLLLEI